MEPQNPYPRPAPSNPLDFSVIGEAFNYVKSNPGPFIVATLLAIIPTGAAQGLVRAMQPTDPNQQLAFLPINFGLGSPGRFWPVRATSVWLGALSRRGAAKP